MLHHNVGAQIRRHEGCSCTDTEEFQVEVTPSAIRGTPTRRNMPVGKN
jgi:hypothetical protein